MYVVEWCLLSDRTARYCHYKHARAGQVNVFSDWSCHQKDCCITEWFWLWGYKIHVTVYLRWIGLFIKAPNILCGLVVSWLLTHGSRGKIIECASPIVGRFLSFWMQQHPTHPPVNDYLTTTGENLTSISPVPSSETNLKKQEREHQSSACQKEM